MHTMSKNQREKLSNALQEMEDLLEMIRTNRFDFGLSWRDEEKLWAIKHRAETIICKLTGIR